MEFRFSITNQAVLRSGEDIEGNRWTIRCEVHEVPPDARALLAERQLEDTFVCEGVVNGSGQVEPRLGEYGEPVLLQVDGTDLRALVEAVRQDQREVEEYLAQARSEHHPTEA